MFFERNIKRAVASAAVLFCAIALCSAAGLSKSVRLRVSHPDGIYAKGEVIRVYADVQETPSAAVKMKLIRDSQLHHPELEKELTLKPGENLLLEQAFDEAQSVIVSLKSDDEEIYAGALVAPEELKPGFEEPKDLMKFWKNEFRQMRRLKMESVETSMEVPGEEAEKYEAWNVEVNCVGPKPVRGIMACPKGAAPHSLPIVIFLHAAGRTPGTQSHLSTALDFARMGALAIDVNAHGFLNGQSDEYYNDLYAGELKDYSTREPDTRDNYYFKWMFLRAERTVDYMVKNPLWDGKHIIVVGTSQGGGQSAFLAGIDPRITAAALCVPAMIDQGASLRGRYNSWPKVYTKYPEKAASVSPYFDPALLLKHTKAEIWCEIGLFDFTCPPANVYAGMNEARTSKTIICYQRNHKVSGGENSRHQWVIDSRIRFYERVLKN